LFRVTFYKQDDSWMWATLFDGDKPLPAHTELAWTVPRDLDEVKVYFNGGSLTKVSHGNLITLNNDGRIKVSAYEAPQHLAKVV
jgi:hypothetical protein